MVRICGNGVLRACCVSVVFFALQLPLLNGEDRKMQVIPLASYEFVSAGERELSSPGAGLVVVAGESITAAQYSRHLFAGGLPDGYPDGSHSVELMHTGKNDRHNWLAVFKTGSDQPVYGGFDTFQTAAVYGYELFRGGRTSLVAGGGAAMSDFGMELPDGRPLYILPVPYISIEYSAPWLAAAFSFITGPNLEFTVAPQSRVHLKGDVRIDQLRDVRDIIFEGSLNYRFFDKTHAMGDIAGISAGIKNDIFDFTSGKLDESYDMAYYALFGKLDLSLLQITGGYTFGGRERFGSSAPRVIGSGFIFSLEAMFPF